MRLDTEKIGCVIQIDYMKWAEGGTVQWSAAYGLFYGGLCQILVGMWSVGSTLTAALSMA